MPPTRKHLPLIQWGPLNPPKRLLLVPAASSWRKAIPPIAADLDTGLHNVPFDLTHAITEVVHDIRRCCPDFQHIDLNRMMIGIFRAKSTGKSGLIARVHPLRFMNGSLLTRKRSQLYTVQRFRYESREMLYFMSFCLPRFLDRSPDDKLVTIIHELFHISEKFDGDFRRLGGRCEVHSGRKKNYDAHMAVLAKQYLNNGADRTKLAFFQLNFMQLSQRHTGVVGYELPVPMLLPVHKPTA